ncbi:MAG: class I SAM-dependent methyltransferase [Ilumatobacteraceae bacterium]
MTVERLGALELKVDGLYASVDALDVHLPIVLNAIASTNGTARILTRETRQRLDELTKATWEGDDAVRAEFRPHIETLAWLTQRVETIRAEMMHELRYGQSHDTASIETKIVSDAHLTDADIRLNLGAGHIAIDGFVNVDMRELPGIDVVAPIENLPFEPGTIAEIFSSHTVEHFPEQELRRKLLPYWIGLLRPGGVFRAIVPDLEAMTKAYTNGELSFETLRAVTYGGQEYEGDFHFTGFTPESMSRLLVDSGLKQPTIIASGRPNGDCLEFEISAVKPHS